MMTWQELSKVITANSHLDSDEEEETDLKVAQTVPEVEAHYDWNKDNEACSDNIFIEACSAEADEIAAFSFLFFNWKLFFSTSNVNSLHIFYSKFWSPHHCLNRW